MDLGWALKGGKNQDTWPPGGGLKAQGLEREGCVGNSEFRLWLHVPLPVLLHPCCLSLATQPPFLWLCPLQVPAPGPELSSMSHWQFQPPQRLQQTNVALLGRETVGKKVRPGVANPIPNPHPLLT